MQWSQTTPFNLISQSFDKKEEEESSLLPLIF